MKKMIVILFISAVFGPLFCYEEPIFHVNNVTAGINYTAKDFYVYNYSDSYFQAFLRLSYSGMSYRQYVSVIVTLFKNGTLVGTNEAFVEYETYGSSGMFPNSESYLSYYLDKVDFDSVEFNVNYLSSDGSKPRFNRHAITVTNTVITPFSGSTKKVAGIVKNLSGTILKYPCVFMCLYQDNKMVKYKMAFADAPDNRLEPSQTATFYTYMDLPESYDSLKFIPNYAPSLTGPVIISSVLSNEKNEMQMVFSLSQNYPNPFNSSTMIPFFIDRPQEIKLELFDINGRSIMILFNGAVDQGEHSIKLAAGALASGNYFCVLSGEGKRVSRKISIIK